MIVGAVVIDMVDDLISMKPPSNPFFHFYDMDCSPFVWPTRVFDITRGFHAHASSIHLAVSKPRRRNGPLMLSGEHAGLATMAGTKLFSR